MPEEWLQQFIQTFNLQKQKDSSESRKSFLRDRSRKEMEELDLNIRTQARPKEEEKQGRISGSREWRGTIFVCVLVK